MSHTSGPCKHPARSRFRMSRVAGDGTAVITEQCDCGVFRVAIQYLNGSARGPFCKWRLAIASAVPAKEPT